MRAVKGDLGRSLEIKRRSHVGGEGVRARLEGPLIISQVAEETRHPPHDGEGKNERAWREYCIVRWIDEDL